MFINNADIFWVFSSCIPKDCLTCTWIRRQVITMSNLPTASWKKLQDRGWSFLDNKQNYSSSIKQLVNDRALPSYCKKRDGAQSLTFSLIPQEQIQTPWHHPVNAFTVSILIIFQTTTNWQEKWTNSAFCYSKLVILYFLEQNSAEAAHLGNFI